MLEAISFTFSPSLSLLYIQYVDTVVTGWCFPCQQSTESDPLPCEWKATYGLTSVAQWELWLSNTTMPFTDSHQIHRDDVASVTRKDILGSRLYA